MEVLSVSDAYFEQVRRYSCFDLLFIVSLSYAEKWHNTLQLQTSPAASMREHYYYLVRIHCEAHPTFSEKHENLHLREHGENIREEERNANGTRQRDGGELEQRALVEVHSLERVRQGALVLVVPVLCLHDAHNGKPGVHPDAEKDYRVVGHDADVTNHLREHHYGACQMAKRREREPVLLAVQKQEYLQGIG